MNALVSQFPLGMYLHVGVQEVYLQVALFAVYKLLLGI